MHHEFASTKPAVAPNDIEWAFADGVPSIVAHVPDGEGNYVVIRLDQIAPVSLYEREHVKALMRIAERVLADSEPAVTTGCSA